MLKGNKGEWSEVYVFLRLLASGKLYAADADLNKNNDVFYSVIGVVREEQNAKLEFVFDRRMEFVSVYDVKTGVQLIALPCSEFQNMADRLYSEIVSGSAAFSSDEVESFLAKIGVRSLKAKSSDKSDIRIRIHDINTGYETVQGFSIKSGLGSPSTLINAGTTTNFIYEITGDVNDNVMTVFNNCSSLFKSKFKYLFNYTNCGLKYVGMENATYEANLRLIDGDLPEICAHMLVERYSTGVNSVEACLASIAEDNPMGYNLSMGHPFYRYKFKKLLSESALGMLPSKPWDGTADATGGYIVVREDGEVLCYHLFNRNEFENYLLENTKFDTGSTGRHQFGDIYKENGKYYLKLNLQIRFIK